MLTEEERAQLDADELVFGKHVRNRTIFTGDNLDVLRGMNDDCIDLIYLDPPFNSNAEYENPFDKGVRFHDIWSWSKVRQDWLNAIAWNQPALHAIIAAASFTSGERMQSYLAYMVVRLVEMRRVLKKDTGAIYLHCDDNAMHYLKPCMDFIFTGAAYQATIAWKRTSAHNNAKTWGRVTDYILNYGAPPKNLKKVRGDLQQRYQSSFYKFGDPEEDLSQWSIGDLTGDGFRSGESGQAWRGIDPAAQKPRHWAVPHSGDYAEWIEENLIPGYTSIESVHARLDSLDEAGLIAWPQKTDGVPRLKRYLAGSRGQIPANIWTDIRPVPRSEDTGYPTQKPLALLRRIIAASTDEGDVVLDPFCGCATACVAAETMLSPGGRQHERRKWIGIDVSAEAYSQVVERLEKTAKLNANGEDGSWRLGLVHHKTLEYEPLITETKRRRGVEKVIVHQWSLVGGDAPVRSDNLVEGSQAAYAPGDEDAFALQTKLHRSSDDRIRAARYFQQNGRCAADGESLPERHLNIEHIVAKDNEGPDVDANIQLMCQVHNSKKGKGTMADLDARMRRDKETPWPDRPAFIAQAEEWFLPPHMRKPLPLRGLRGGG